MLELTAEFKMRTVVGLADCKVVNDVFGNPRDFENAEKAIAWMRKVFAHGMDCVMTFGYFDEHEYNLFRIFEDYKDGEKEIREIHWDMYGNVVHDEFHKKLTTKLIRKLYLETADAYIDHKAEVGA